MSGKRDRVKDNERTSIIVPNLNKCFVCGTDKDIHLHEVFYGSSNRKKSKEDGMVIPLCGPHHNLSSNGIHYNKILDEKVKKQAEKIWIKNYCDEELSPAEKINSFIKRFGINYLEEDELC